MLSSLLGVLGTPNWHDMGGMIKECRNYFDSLSLEGKLSLIASPSCHRFVVYHPPTLPSSLPVGNVWNEFCIISALTSDQISSLHALGADIAAIGNSGSLLRAVGLCNEEAVKSFLDFGCDVNLSDDTGFSPIHCAAFRRAANASAEFSTESSAESRTSSAKCFRLLLEHPPSQRKRN